MKNRKWHRWAALVTFLPFTLILLSGIVLQFKRWIPAIQPSSQKSSQGGLSETFPALHWQHSLETLRQLPEAEVKTWNDVKTIDIRPKLGVARFRTQNGFEVQIDLANGKPLQVQKRLTGLITEIHEGSFFGDGVRNFIFIPTAFFLFFLTLTGILILKPYYFKKSKKLEKLHGQE